MKFSSDKNIIYEAVSSASKACGVKSPLNVLDGVFLELLDNTLTIVGYDLEISIKVSIEVEGYSDGKIIVDPKLFSEIVKKMPGDTVNFELLTNETKGTKTIKITSGKSKLNISCKDGSEFPEIGDMKGESSFKINEGILRELFSKVGFCVSKSNHELECIKIDIDNEFLYAVATDGSRLAVKYYKSELVVSDFKNNNNDNPILSISIPEKAVLSLIKNLSDNGEGVVEISVDENQISLVKEGFILVSRLIEGKFVNYKRIIESSFSLILSVNVKEIVSSMERILLLNGDKLKIPVTCSFGDDSMRLFCKTPLAIIDDEIPIEINEGDFSEFSINFNPRLMLDALLKTNCERIKISFESSLKPIKLTPLEDDGEFVFIIASMR